MKRSFRFVLLSLFWILAGAAYAQARTKTPKSRLENALITATCLQQPLAKNGHPLILTPDLKKNPGSFKLTAAAARASNCEQRSN